MARTPRRHAVSRVHASLLIAALACPAVLTGTVTAAQASDVIGTDTPAQTTPPPPPSPTQPPPETSATPTPPPSPTAPDTTPSSGNGDTPTTDDSTGTGGTDRPTPSPPTEQTEELDAATTSLNEVRNSVPEELRPTVDELTTSLETAAAPETSPQDRQGVIESTQQLTTALEALAADDLPDEQWDQLSALVQQMSSALTTGLDPEVPPEERSLLILVTKRTVSALPLISDPGTPQDLRNQLTATSKQLNKAVSNGWDVEKVGYFARPVAALLETAAGSAPEEQKEELVRTAHDQSRPLGTFSDPRTSPEDRARAEKDMRDRGAQVSEQQEEAASAEEQPGASLARAAAVCTSAIFESVSEQTLADGLEGLVPDDWGAQGVKDFWKAEEKDEQLLDVLAQLGNDERVHGPFEIASLMPQLAEILPRDELFGTLGTPASQCEQAASELDQDQGVDTGTWLADAG